MNTVKCIWGKTDKMSLCGGEQTVACNACQIDMAIGITSQSTGPGSKMLNHHLVNMYIHVYHVSHGKQFMRKKVLRLEMTKNGLFYACMESVSGMVVLLWSILLYNSPIIYCLFLPDQDYGNTDAYKADTYMALQL